MQTKSKNVFVLFLLFLVLSLIPLFLLFQRGLVFSYSGVFSIIVWIWCLLLFFIFLFFLFSFFNVIKLTNIFLKFGLSLDFRVSYLFWFFILLSILITLNIFLQVLPTNETNIGNNISSDGVMSIQDKPTSFDKNPTAKVSMTLKNNFNVAITYDDFMNNIYGLELWQKDKSDDNTGDEWVLESQSYQYFKDLKSERKMMIEDFGTIEPGGSKSINLTFQNLNVLDTTPITGSQWEVIGNDSSGTFYARNPLNLQFTCGYGIYHFEFGKVINSKFNPRGIFIADLDTPLISPEFSTGVEAKCTAYTK